MNGDWDPIESAKTRSKPRLVKLRKHSAFSNNPNLNVFPETSATFDPGFNPFRPSLVPDSSFSIKGNLNLANDVFLFDSKTTPDRGFLDNSVLDSMMKLKIGSNPFSDLNLKPSDEAGNSRLEDELGKLRIENPENENVKSGLDMDTDAHSFGKFVEMELPDDLKKLNIEDRSEAGGSSLNSNVDDNITFVHKNWNQRASSFDGSSEKVYFGRAENVLSNEMGRLKLAREVGDVPINIISNSTESIYSGLAPKNLEFNAKREPTKDARLKKNRGNLKKAVPVSQDFIFRENSTSLQEDSFESYSPMDVSSPYHEPVFDNVKIQDSEEIYVESLSADVNEAATDDDLVIATQCLDINDTEFTERKGESRSFIAKESFDAEFSSYSEAETESFVTADVQFDDDSSSKSDTFVTAEDKEVSSSSKGETEIQRFSCGPTTSEDFGKTKTNFTFAAATSSSAHSQSSSSTRQKKKKNSYKVSHEAYPSSKIQPSSSSMQFFRPSETSSVLSPRWGQKGDVPNSFAKKGDMAEAADKNQEIEEESSFTPAASIASLEACDKWRLRGNQAYANGDMLRADEYYSQGVNCISQNENSRSCLRALMLCYSNRAATRMSLGRVREALEDCKRAVVIDPNFLRVQVRAANCYLALGDVEDASRHFAKCLQSGNDLSAERKLALEASEGLTKSKRVSEWMKQSTELVHKTNSNAAEKALEVIAKALTISCYSEKLLELKAEALFMLGKYEDLIHLCEQTLYSAEMNHAAVHADDLSNMEYSDGQLNFSFRLWRCRLIIKSYFSLGRLEAALDFLKKQEESTEIGSQSLESTTPLVGTIRKLVYNKGAGNEAFKRGNYAEAVEHYTAALSSTVESRPFAAVCFCNRAAAYKAMDQVIDAIADCSIAIALDGNYLKAISRRASLFEMIRDYDQATKDMQKVESLLTKQVEEDGQFGPTDKLRSLNDLRQAQQRQSALEENAKLEIPLNMYLILGVDPSVPASEIKKAYRKAALKHHPDKSCQFFARSECIDDGLWKEVVVEVHKDTDRIFKMIGEAYAILSDPRKRSQYDIDEESRTAQKRGFEGRRMHTFNSPYERESGSSEQEGWKTYGNKFQSRGT